MHNSYSSVLDGYVEKGFSHFKGLVRVPTNVIFLSNLDLSMTRVDENCFKTLVTSW